MKARDSWDIDLWFAWSHSKYQPKDNIPENFVFLQNHKGKNNRAQEKSSVRNQTT